LGVLLKEARGHRSKYVVAKTTDIPAANIAGYEAGSRYPNMQTLHKLCSLYEIDFDAAVVLMAHERVIDGADSSLENERVA